MAEKIKPAGIAQVNIVETVAFGSAAHHWSCGVCGEESARTDAKRDGEPRKAVTDGATAHAAKHTDAQDAIDAAKAAEPRCTCGALQHTGCFCDITLAQFLATPASGGEQRRPV